MLSLGSPAGPGAGNFALRRARRNPSLAYLKEFGRRSKPAASNASEPKRSRRAAKNPNEPKGVIGLASPIRRTERTQVAAKPNEPETCRIPRVFPLWRRRAKPGERIGCQLVETRIACSMGRAR
jgi:hypothetical protein